MATAKTLRRLKIKKRIRKKMSGTASVPRLSVFRSNTAIYAQLIDDVTSTTLAYASSREFSKKMNTNVSDAVEVGKKLGERAIAKGISKVVFDRNGYLYHGKVKALADGAREAGLVF